MVGIAAVPQLVTIHIAKHRNGPRADLDVCFHPGSNRFHDLPTLTQPAAQAQSPSSIPTPTDQPSRHFPRLMDIFEQAKQRQPRQEKPQAEPKSYSQKSELPRGYVLNELGADSKSETEIPIASLVHEQEQNPG